MPRQIIYVTLILCLLGCACLQADDTPQARYPLPYAPLACVRAESLDSFDQLSAFTHMQMLYAIGILPRWGECPLLGTLPPSALQAWLRTHKAGELQAFVLPPEALGKQPRLLFHVTFTPGHTPQAKERLQKLSPRLSIEAEGDSLWIANSAALHMERKQQRSSKPTDRPWSTSLNAFLHEPADGIALWSEATWLSGILLAKTGVDIRTRLEEDGWQTPTAFRARCTVRNKALLVEADLDLPTTLQTPNIPSSTDTAFLSAPLFPKTCEIVLGLHLDTFTAPYLTTDGSSKSPLLDRLLALVKLADPLSASDLASGTEAWQMLSGVHLTRDLTAAVGPWATLAIWQHPQHTRRSWALVAPLRQAQHTRFLTALQRMQNWLNFLTTGDGWNFPSPTHTENRWEMEIRTHRGNTLTLVFSNDWLVLTENNDYARQLWQHAKQARPRWTANASIAWQAHPHARVLREAIPDNPFVSFLAGLVRQERGGFRFTPSGIHAYLEGSGAPISTALLAERAGNALQQSGVLDTEVSPRLSRLRLRLFLEAAQHYKHLNLGEFNGQANMYPATLGDLVDGRGEDGKPLARMYSTIYDPPVEKRTPYTILFADLARYLSRGRPVDGYAYYPVTQNGSRTLNRTHEWALLAWPQETNRHPAYMICEDGTLLARPVKPTETAPDIHLPAAPIEEGWIPVQ